MDIIKFNNPTNVTKMEDAEIVNGLTSKLWIERFVTEGEFKLVGKLSSGLKETLPIGSFISHLDAYEIMIVEDHEITSGRGIDPEITITGRSFETFLERKLLGQPTVFPRVSSGFMPGGYIYIAATARPASQMVALIEASIDPGFVPAADAVDYVKALSASTPVGATTSRTFPGGNLYKTVIEFLTDYGLGIRSMRPGPWQYSGMAGVNTGLVIYGGVDLTNSVVFSYDAGEIERADYFWSDRKKKTAINAYGDHVMVQVTGPEVGFHRRMLHARIPDVDTETTVPAGAALTAIEDTLTRTGRGILSTNAAVSIMNVQIAKGGTRWKYREDYNLGDYVTVSGEFDANAEKRVVEYVEIEDENGRIGNPTLAEV